MYLCPSLEENELKVLNMQINIKWLVEILKIIVIFKKLILVFVHLDLEQIWMW